MPVSHIISLLLLPALATWLFATLFIYLIFNPIQGKKFLGLAIQGFLPANKEKLITAITTNISTIFFTDKIIQNTLLNADAINKLKPEIESHVDVFLREKLKESFPMMHQLMGEKTLARFKEVFLNEVEELLPVIIQKHASGLLESKALQKLLANKLQVIPPGSIAAAIKQVTARQLFYVKLFAILLGLIVGIFQIFIVLLLNQNAV